MTAGPTITAVVTTLLIALAAALPWGTGETFRLVLPMLPIIAIIFWSLAPQPMPATVVFGSGLFSDLATQSPVGFWTAIALVVALFCRAATDARRSLLARGIVALAAMALVAFLSWGLTYLYTLLPPAIWPYVEAAGYGVAAMIPIMGLLAMISSIATRGDRQRTILGRSAR